MLLDRHADVNARDKNYNTPLHSVLKILYVSTDVLVLHVDANTEKILTSKRFSLQQGTQLAELLLESGADPNARDNSDNTSLHFASISGQVDVAEALINRGVDTNARNNADNTPLHLASKTGHVKIVEILLNRGADMNARNNDNTMPLHFASQGGHLKIVRMLLDPQEGVNARDKNYKTPLRCVLQDIS
jgi:cytohesin